jgi:cAMP-dependent protein kinase regulator
MTDMKANIQGLFASAECVKDGKIPKDELSKVCVHLGMTADEVTVMCEEIDKEATAISVDSFMDWVFGAAAAAEAPAEEKKAEEPEEEEEEDDVEDELDEPPPPPKSGGARSSVSAEAYGAWNVKKAFEAPFFEKTDEQKQRIKGVLGGSFLFQAVDTKDFDTLLGAVKEEQVTKDTRVINKGDDGDFMCIIESGTFDCLIKGDDGEEKSVKTCEPGDVFGELALMYNCPRAASVVATTEGTYWKLDRETFNYIVRDAAQKKRETYESFLKSVPLLEKMTAYEKAQIADALKEEMVADGAIIVSEGDAGDKFYILGDGTAEAKKKDVEGSVSYKAGDYFGELALQNDAPRAATVTAGPGCKVLTLDRKSFKRLLGSVDELGKKEYAGMDTKAEELFAEEKKEA